MDLDIRLNPLEDKKRDKADKENTFSSVYDGSQPPPNRCGALNLKPMVNIGKIEFYEKSNHKYQAFLGQNKSRIIAIIVDEHAITKLLQDECINRIATEFNYDFFVWSPCFYTSLVLLLPPHKFNNFHNKHR